MQMGMILAILKDRLGSKSMGLMKKITIMLKICYSCKFTSKRMRENGLVVVMEAHFHIIIKDDNEFNLTVCDIYIVLLK